MHALDAAVEQAEHHRARRTAGAQHQRILALVPAGRAGVEIVDKAFDVGVGRAQLAVLEPQRIGRADRARARIRLRQRERALLVRKCDVGADEAAQRQPEQEILELVGRHRLDDIAALDPERPQPVMMDQRRTRMRGRPSDQARGGGLCCTCHGSQIGQAGPGVNALLAWRSPQFAPSGAPLIDFLVIHFPEAGSLQIPIGLFEHMQRLGYLELR